VRSVSILAVVFVIWELICRLLEIPAWLLPQPTQIFSALVADISFLVQSLYFTA